TSRPCAVGGRARLDAGRARGPRWPARGLHRLSQGSGRHGDRARGAGQARAFMKMPSGRFPDPGGRAQTPTQRTDLDVAIVGAGICGLTAAIALARKGIRVTVFEQARELTPVGASLALGPNAVRLLAALDLLEAARQVGVRAEAVELVRWDDGAVLLHTPLGAAAEAYFGAPALDFMRSDLQRVLLDALPEGVLTLGAQVTAL